METRRPSITTGADFYKSTMSQFEYERHPDTEVTFTFKNRGKEPLSRYVTPEELRERFDTIMRNGFQPEEIACLASFQAQDGTARFTPEYLDHLADMQLPELEIGTDPQTGDIAIETTGPWSDVSFWETVVMSELNEAFYRGKMAAEGLDLADLYAEGDRRLSEKIARLQARPDIKIAEFGTRRRFSAAWQEHVIGRLAAECPDNLVGTSNIWFAHKFGLQPIGTFAHELPMVSAALEDLKGGNPLDGHDRVMNDWGQRYPDLRIMLPDTYTSQFCLSSLTREQLETWRGFRHDSGDPIEFGEQLLALYKKYNINPREKLLVPSDGLDMDKMERIANHFGDKINIFHGLGTNATNDLGLPANNFVMKATYVRTPERPEGTPAVKLSDENGKHTGPEWQVRRYQQFVRERIAQRAMNQLVRV